MTFKIITLGCKVNQYESQAMTQALLAAGFAPALPGEPAGLVVVNSCTVTAQSDHKVRQALRRARRENPQAVTVLTGCMPQAFPDAAALSPARTSCWAIPTGKVWSLMSRSSWPPVSDWWTWFHTSLASLSRLCGWKSFTAGPGPF